ncbi:efflux RND transporter periplasmic adaptor subunit [Pseudomonas abieticivorans]|uniref:efflux RND transporter periplasmic adaptor subunit n=1 Tax=Pseudomonas abieticivorans TaxID=2931382 RepID=UPI0020C12F86|nr:HlyD family secretion protein [Pseudomonas sp. PIA16]
MATLGWALSEPGALRNALLYLATTSWALSLALNASPFMRFDGYFILSDLLDFPNLLERASALARVAIRRSLLGLREPWPESFSPERRGMLITFAIITWLYRLVLFLGIAYAVYLFFFKLLGIVLFAVELSWFIAMPVIREIKHWWKHRAKVPSRRRLLLGAVLANALVLLAIPWHSEIDAYGVAHAERQLRVFAPAPARMQSIKAKGAVRAGDALVTLDDPDIAARIASSNANARSYEARLSGLIADPTGYAEQTATRQRMIVQFEEARAARSEITRLTLQAPFDGVWLDTNPDLQPGQWVSTQESLGVLIDPVRWQVDAYVAQDQIQRIAVGDSVHFYPEGQPTFISGTVFSISTTRVSQLPYRMLASRFGGPIPTTTSEKSLIPVAPVFQVGIRFDNAASLRHETRGHVKIRGQQRSYLADVAIHLASVFMRESGF